MEELGPTSKHKSNANVFIFKNYVNGYVFINVRAATKNFVIVFVFNISFEYDFAGVNAKLESVGANLQEANESPSLDV